MPQTKVNLACGNVFVTADDWINFDYSPASPAQKGQAGTELVRSRYRSILSRGCHD
jgi:hypothetical protein